MYFDILNDFIMNSTIFYVYFGILFSSFGLVALYSMSDKLLQEPSAILVNDFHGVNINIEYYHRPAHKSTSFVEWFIVTYKRMALPDKDDEDPSHSNFLTSRKIRGGQIWRKVYVPLSRKAFYSVSLSV